VVCAQNVSRSRVIRRRIRFKCCLFIHGRLSRSRPSGRRLRSVIQPNMPSGAWRGWLAQHIKRSSWIAGRSIHTFSNDYANRHRSRATMSRPNFARGCYALPRGVAITCMNYKRSEWCGRSAQVVWRTNSMFL
jgi:hypothetical protein